MTAVIMPTGRYNRRFSAGGLPTPFDSGSAGGESDESKTIGLVAQSVVNHYFVPISRISDDPVRRFYSLFWSWKEDVKVLSDIDIICTHPSYQQIIGMGLSALPMIFFELQKNPDDWFWALKAITGADPVRERDRGRVRLMQRAWLDWGQQQGYV